MPRPRLSLEGAGALVLVVLTVLAIGMIAGALGMKTAATDLAVQVERLKGGAVTRNPIGPPLAAVFASDVAADDARELSLRSQELDRRGDRLIEATAVVGLLGMLVALGTARSASDLARSRDSSSPLARTINNGNV